VNFAYAATGILAGVFASMGLGGNAILIVYLTLFLGISQKSSQGIGLFFFIPVALISIIIYAKKQLIEWKFGIPCAILGVAGTFLGFYISNFIDQILLSKIFGLMFFLTGIFQWFKKD
jgi:uncharacterized membrane protein YfcA